MKAILVGYSKTGTKTMAAAFRILGYKTYDVDGSFFFLHKEWNKIRKGEATTQEIAEMFHGVDALCDYPAFVYWKELVRAFPQAKIILTTRNEDAWFKSMVNQLEVLNSSWLSWFTVIFSPLCWMRAEHHRALCGYYGKFKLFPSNRIKPHPEEIFRQRYRRHNDDVLENAPHERLLVYEVTQGWEPLCEFLGEETPDVAFPHKNRGGDFLRDLTKTTFALKLLGTAVLTFSGLVAGVAYMANRFYGLV